MVPVVNIDLETARTHVLQEIGRDEVSSPWNNLKGRPESLRFIQGHQRSAEA